MHDRANRMFKMWMKKFRIERKESFVFTSTQKLHNMCETCRSFAQNYGSEKLFMEMRLEGKKF